MLKIVIGGSGSGKSEYAEGLAMKSVKPLIYIATMKPFGEEGLQRIKRHREMRRDKGFLTVERYDDIAGVSVDENSTILLECMGNLLANEMFGGEEGNIREYKLISDIILEGIRKLNAKAACTIIVTNDVFSSGLVYDESTLLYMKALAYINLKLAEWADEVTEVVCGIPIHHKKSGRLVENDHY